MVVRQPKLPCKTSEALGGRQETFLFVTKFETNRLTPKNK